MSLAHELARWNQETNLLSTGRKFDGGTDEANIDFLN